MRSTGLQSSAPHPGGNHSHQIAPADDRWINVQEVCARTDRHRATIYRMIADGHFPAGKLRRGRRTWWLSTVLAWMDEESDAPPT